MTPAPRDISAPHDDAHGAAPGATPLDRLAADYWDAYVEAHPLFATSVGDHRFDALLADATPEGEAADRTRLAELLERLDAMPGQAARPGPVGPSSTASIVTGDREAITRSALREALLGDIALLDTGLIAWNVDPLEGVPADFLLVPDYQRLEAPGDADAMVERWRAMALYTDRHVASLRRSLAEGRVACRAPVDRTIAILEELLGSPDDEWPLLAPLAAAARVPGWTVAERESFAADLRSAVANEVRPSLARLHDALAGEIGPAARPPDEPGMCHVPRGAEAYRQLIRVHTSLDADPEDLHQTGLAEIERIDMELEALAARTLGTNTLGEALAALRGDPALQFVTRDEVFDKAVTSLARATEAIPDWFGRLPRAACEVVRMGSHEEEHSTIAYYRQPAPDGSRPGQFFVNTSQPGTRPRYEAEALAYHEAIPGHHLQIAIGQELPGLPEFRRHLGPTAFFEGWGLYTERLADEMGLYTGDLDRIGVLSFDAWRAARLVVDTGMHALGWTRDRAIGFMLDHTALGANNVANEVDRYIVLPGQALAYKTGQLEMLALRAHAQDRLGTAFDIRAFHDTLLDNGALALPTLREIVGSWVDRTARG
jgi:uncharacterized protein (DUF885 family)